MIVNSDKFQTTILDKCGSDNTNMEVKIGNEKIKSTSSVTLVGVHIDDKLNLNYLFKKKCKSARKQLNAPTRLKSFSFLGFSQKFYILKF